VFDCANDTSTQVSLVSEATVQGFDAIVIEPKDQTALNTVLTDAEKAGIVVIKQNQGADAVTTLHVKSDSYSAGFLAGEGIVKLLNNKGNVALIDCPAGQVASTTFSKGFKDYIASYPDVKIIDYQNCKSYSQEDAFTVMADMLTKHDDINAVYAISDDMAAGAIQAIEAAGRKNILVWGAGCKPSGIANIKAGKQAGTTWPDIYTTVTISLNSALQYVIVGVNGYELGYTKTPLIVNKMELVTADNIDKVLPYTRWPEKK
jgi:ribose transport system substrate-binding protein